MGWTYRIRQFFEAMLASPTAEDLDHVRQTLTPKQVALFDQLQPSEQAHAVRVLREVNTRYQQKGCVPPPDLQVAALLHDVGKARYPLRVWERVLIVLGKALFPEAVARWGMAEPHGWKRPFVIAAQHPAWGAEMAAGQGTSSLAVAIIRRHQERIPLQDTEEDRLLAILQAVDDEN